MTINAQIKQCESSFCCHEPSFCIQKKEDKMEKAFRIAQKICAVALGMFAALTSFGLFAPSFAIGALVGVFTYKERAHHHHHNSEGSCSHGFIEQTTGVKLPAPLALLAGMSVLAIHIEEHAPVFVPIVGLTLGIWAGNSAAPSLNHCFRKFVAFLSNRSFYSCP